MSSPKSEEILCESMEEEVRALEDRIESSIEKISVFNRQFPQIILANLLFS